MKYYYGILNGDGTTSAAKTILHGSIKPSNSGWKHGRIDCFQWVGISDYWWNCDSKQWEHEDDIWDENDHIKNNFYINDSHYKIPKSFKAFNRYVQKLLKEYHFPKGTVIQLSGRFNGVGIYCITGESNEKK